MNHIARVLLVSAIISSLLLVGSSQHALAARPDRFGVGFGQNAGLGTRDVRDTVSALIRTALGILGVLMLLLILWAVVGAAAGGDEAAAHARSTISGAVIGLIVIFVAYALTVWVFNVLERAT